MTGTLRRHFGGWWAGGLAGSLLAVLTTGVSGTIGRGLQAQEPPAVEPAGAARPTPAPPAVPAPAIGQSVGSVVAPAALPPAGQPGPQRFQFTIRTDTPVR